MGIFWVSKGETEKAPTGEKKDSVHLKLSSPKLYGGWGGVPFAGWPKPDRRLPPGTESHMSKNPENTAQSERALYATSDKTIQQWCWVLSWLLTSHRCTPPPAEAQAATLPGGQKQDHKANTWYPNMQNHSRSHKDCHLTIIRFYSGLLIVGFKHLNVAGWQMDLSVF